MGEAKWYNILPDYSIYIPQILEEQKASIIDIKPEYLNEFYNLKSSGILTEDDFGGFVYANAMKNDVSFDNLDGLSSVPGTFEHFLKTKTGDTNTLIKNHINYLNGDTSIKDTIFTEWHKYSKRYDATFLNTIDSHQLQLDLGIQPKELGFSSELKAYLNLVNNPKEEQNQAGAAFKRLLKWVTGKVTYTNGCENFLVNGATNQNVDLFWTDSDTKVTPICSGEYQLMAFSVLGSSNDKKVALICEPGATFVGGQTETAFKITGDNVIISGCTFKNFNTAISGEEKSNIEFFGNTFINNDIAIQLNNWKDMDDIKKPTAKIIGNTFENTDNLVAIASNLFNGEMVISNNDFSNAGIALVGDNKNQEATSISTITKNKFTRTNSELVSTLVLSYIDEGIIYGNRFENAKNQFGELVIIFSSDIIVNNNLFTADESTESISLNLNEINEFTFTNNYIQGFAKSIIGVKLINSLFQNNYFKDNNLIIQFSDSENGIFSNNNFVNNKGMQYPQQPQLLPNIGILLTKFEKGLFFNNQFDSTKNNFIVLLQSPNNYLYNINDNLVYVMQQTQGSGPGSAIVPVSSAYMFYPLTFDIKRKYLDATDTEKVMPLEMAQISVKDTSQQKSVDILQALSGIVGTPLNQNIYLYSFTKKPNNVKELQKSYTYSVSYGKDDAGANKELITLPAEVTDLTSQQNIAVEFDDDCISPPVDYNINYKTFNPLTSAYTDSIPLLPIPVNPTNGNNEYTNILITQDTTFCGGLYEIYDGDSDVNKGIIQFEGETPITLKCKGTQFKGKDIDGDSLGEGAGIYISQKDDVAVEGCTLMNYDNGLLAVGSKNVGVKSNVFKDNNIGLQLNQEDTDIEVNAEINLNTFENNKDWNLLFINPASDNPSYVFNNIFKNTNPANHPSVKFDLLENDAATPLDSQVMLYKDGQGNYWEDYSNVAGVSCADSYINYKDSYADADKGNDGFCDKAYKFKANSNDPKYDLLDKYPYSSIIDFSKIIPKTSATVSLSVDNNNNLVATTINYETFVTGVSYNWVVDDKSMTVLNLPMNTFDTTGAEMYKITDISGNNLIAYAGDGTGKNVPELTDEGVGKGMKFNGNEFIKIPYANNLDKVKINELDEFGVEFIFKSEQDVNHPDNILVVRANENEGFLIGTNKKTEDGIEKDNFVFMLFKNVEDNDKKTSIPIKTIESILNPLQSWHHFVGVFDKTTSKLEFYIDGVKITDDNNADFSGHENLIFNNNDIYFGKFPEKYATDNLVTENGFKGIIDEIKIYNKALSPEQIQANYESIFFEGQLNDQLGPNVVLEVNNKIIPSTHGDCGNWKVKSWLTTNEGFLISTDALGAGYNSFLCGLEVCCDDDPQCTLPKCNAPKKCLPSDKTIDDKSVSVCDYPSCTNDADCGQGENCAFNKCLICKGFKNGANSEIIDDMEITEPTLICAGTYNAVDVNNDGYIKIAKDNVGLMCQDGTKIIGPETTYDTADTTLSKGIFANNVDNINIINCDISNFTNGIVVGQSENSEFTKNILHDNGGALYLSAVKNSKLLNNTITNNIFGLYFEGVESISISGTISTDNQFNALMSGKNIVFNTSNLTNSKHIVDITQANNPLKDISSKDIIIGIISTEISLFKFYDTYFDDLKVYIEESLTDADKLSANANIKRYWTLTTNVVKSSDGMSPVEGASIETMGSNIEGVGMVDVNEDNSIDNKDVSYTDKDGMATTLLLANITDKTQTSTTKDLNPYTITAFKSTGLPGAVPAVSASFTIKEPTFKKLDLDTGKEFEIPKVYESTTTPSSSTGGGGSSYEKTCSPQVDDKCKLKYKYTPCVLQGNISYPTKIFTCNSTNDCGMRLFVEPCEGNAPSYAQGCSNKIKDLFEEGVDCGGPCSKQCAATCTDKKQNQGEIDVDCGGSASGSNACVKCLDDKKCSDNNDCKSGFCKNGWCKQPACYDSFKNQDETNVDCGGKICAPCEGKQEATCYDNIINQGETDVDCGGPCKSCTPILEQPKAFNYYWLLLLLLIPLIAILFYVGYSQYQKQHKPIPPMSKGFGKGNGLKELKGNKSLPSLDDLKLSKELEAELEKPSKFSNKPMPLKKEIFTEFDNVIKDEIKKLLDEGASKHEINEALKAKGYPHEKVNYLFETSLHELLPSKYEEQLKTYINYYLSRGMSKTAIKEALLEKGWNKKIIDGVFGKR